MNKHTTLISLIFLTACGTNVTQIKSKQNTSNGTTKIKPVQTQQQIVDSDIICERTKKVGTRIKKKRCMTAAQKKAKEDRAKEMMSEKQLHNNETIGNLKDGGY